ncbi:MAG: TetR/AcrR family transcriptional regulator [Bacillota bacterium]
MDKDKKTTEDRRVRKTKKLLKDCLASLLMEKNINNITVKEIVDLADLNRGTFYLHYRDVYDMMTQIENEMIEELKDISDRYPAAALKDSPKPYLLDIFRYIAENMRFCKMILGPRGDMYFLDKMKKMVEERCFHTIMEACPKNDRQNYQYFATYAVSGCLGLLQNWLESDMKTTPEELAQVASDLIQNGFDGSSQLTGQKK